MGQLNPGRIRRDKVVALDTVSIIYFLERHPAHFKTANRLFSRIEAGEISGVMSCLVFTELLVPAYRNGKPELAGSTLKILSNFPNLALLPVTKAISQKAAELRAYHNLRTPDAIHVATALAGQADFFVTNDKRLLRLEKERIINILLFS